MFSHHQDLQHLTQKFELSLLQEVSAQWPNRMQGWLPPDWSLERDASGEQALVMVWGPSLKPLPPCTHAGGTGSTRSLPVFADSSGKYRRWRRHQLAVFEKAANVFVVSNSHTIRGQSHRQIPGNAVKAQKFAQQALQSVVKACWHEAQCISDARTVSWVVMGDYNMSREAGKQALLELPHMHGMVVHFGGYSKRDLVATNGDFEFPCKDSCYDCDGHCSGHYHY